ncbi:PKD domain-containing protein [bacterium]|nr:PKD domain-containing protein [bacterium]
MLTAQPVTAQQNQADEAAQTSNKHQYLDRVNYVINHSNGYEFSRNGWVVLGDLNKFRARINQSDVQVLVDWEYCVAEDAEAMYLPGDNDLIIRWKPSDYKDTIEATGPSAFVLWHEAIHAISHGHQAGLLSPSRPFSDWHAGMSGTEEEWLDHFYIEWAENFIMSGLPRLMEFEEGLLKLDKTKVPSHTQLRGLPARWQKTLETANTRFDPQGFNGVTDVPNAAQRTEFEQMVGYHVDTDAMIKGYLAQGYRSEPFGLVAKFTAEPEDPLKPKPIEFDATKSTGAYFWDNNQCSQPKIEHYYWVFNADDPHSQVIATDQPKITEVYDSFGTYRVVLFVTDAHGHISSEFDKQVTVEGIDVKLSAQPSRGPATLNAGLKATVTSASHPQGVLFLWDFDGDGVFDETDNGEHDFRGLDSATAKYEQAGDYRPAVQAIDSQGHSATAQAPVKVTAGLNAVLNATPLNGPPPLAVSFSTAGSSSSAGRITDWEWEFDGNGLYNETHNGEAGARGKSQATHTFDQPGQHTVDVRLTDDQGNSETASVNITVESGLVAAFTFAQPSGPAPVSVTFDAIGCSFPAGETITYLWDFDAAGQGQPYSSPLNCPTIQYPKDGTYKVTLKIRDSQGNESAEAVGYVTVGLANAPPTAALKIIDASTGAKFDAAGAEGMLPLRVKFSAAASTDPDGQVVKYTWYFDDWTQPVVTTTPEVWHEYTLTSIFKPTVIVTDDYGNDSSNQPAVSVKVGIAEPELKYDQASLASGGTEVKFMLLGTYIDGQTALTGVSWDFGDNTQLLGTPNGIATHVFAQPGTYTVSLDVSYASTAGGTAVVKYQKTIQVGNPVTALLQVLDSQGAVATGSVPVGQPLTISAAGSSSTAASIVKCELDLDGDGTFEIDNGPRLAYPFKLTQAGTATIAVRITDALGYSAVKQLAVTAAAQLTAALVVTPPSGPPPLQVTADARGSTNAAGPVDHYIWDINQTGGPSTTNKYVDAELVFTFPDPGEYIISVRACDAQGNESPSAQQRVVVGGSVSADLQANPAGGPLPLVVQLTAAGSTGTPSIVKYEWDLDGDGVYETGGGTSAEQSLTYNTPGDYVAGVRVTDSLGLQDTATVSIHAGAQDNLKAYLRIEIMKGLAEDPRNLAPFKVSLTMWKAYGLSTDYPLVAMEIDYTGDGSFVPVASWGPSTIERGYNYGADIAGYTYTAPGEYTPTLRITDSEGGVALASYALKVD